MLGNEKLEKISDELKEYVEVNYQLLKLQTVEKTANIGSDLLTSVYIGIIGFLTLFFTSMWLAIYISALYNHEYLGYVIISGFYSLFYILFSVFKRSLLFNPIRNRFIRKLTKKCEP